MIFKENVNLSFKYYGEVGQNEGFLVFYLKISIVIIFY